MLIERLQRRFVVRRLGLKPGENQEAEQKQENDATDPTNLRTTHSAPPDGSDPSLMGRTAEENTESISVLAGGLCRELQVQTVSLLARLNLRVRTQQDDRLNLLTA